MKKIIPYKRKDIEKSFCGILKMDKQNVTPEVIMPCLSSIVSSRLGFGLLAIMQDNFSKIYEKMNPVDIDNLINSLFNKVAGAFPEAKSQQDIVYISCAIYSIFVDYSIIYKCNNIPTIEQAGPNIASHLEYMLKDIKKSISE